jgi:glucan 1,3-beta-glucosidase
MIRVGTVVEHHAMYQYQFTNTQDIFMGQIQTETP